MRVELLGEGSISSRSSVSFLVRGILKQKVKELMPVC